MAEGMPPGPRGLPLLGSLIAFRLDTNGFLLELARRYGDLASFQLGRRRAFLLNHPELVKDALVAHRFRFGKGALMLRARRLLGDGLLTSEGELHRLQRRRLQPEFHRQKIAAYGRVMTAAAAQLDARWREGETLDLGKEMMHLSMAIVAKALFDADVEAEAPELGEALAVLGRWFPLLTLPYAEVLERLPLPLIRQARGALDRLNATVHRFIHERRASPRQDVISMLLAIRDEQGTMPDTLIRDETMTLFLAGYETTATALTWTWYLLSQHPEAEARLHAELDTVLGERLPEAEDLPRLEYTERVLAESLRLYPPVGRIGLRPLEDYTVQGTTIPQGSVVFVSPYVSHRDPRWFPEPERFDPERWTPEAKAAQPRYAYFPFGAGPRLCIGESFARMSAVLTLATLARRWRPRLVPGHRVEPQTLITLRPRYGMKMTLERR